MKTRNRIMLAGLAGFLAACGTLVATPETARADPAPKFPTCYGAHVEPSGQLRVWINPGSLYSPKTLKVGSVELDRRRDGIFTGVVVAPPASANNWLLVKMDRTEKAFWVKCKKVKP